jgi:hypothetical protein
MHASPPLFSTCQITDEPVDDQRAMRKNTLHKENDKIKPRKHH